MTTTDYIVFGRKFDGKRDVGIKYITDSLASAELYLDEVDPDGIEEIHLHQVRDSSPYPLNAEQPAYMRCLNDVCDNRQQTR